MRRAPAALAIAGLGLLSAIEQVVSPASPAHAAYAADVPCQRWNLEVTCATSRPRAAINEEFTATVTAKNVGDAELRDVTVRLRGDRGAPCVSGPAAGVTVVVERLAPGESKVLSARFAPEHPGVARVLGGARDGAGLAFGSCAATVYVVENVAQGEDGRTQNWNLEVRCATSSPQTVVSGVLTATVTAKNVGDSDLLKVTITLKPEGVLRCLGDEPTGVAMFVDRLAPGESKELTARLASETIGAAKILGTARDSYATAVGACQCAVDVRGLFAIQSDMTDKALDGTERGVFRRGEEFLYRLLVANEGGTDMTPPLKVRYTLPKELEFVSGTGDAGVTVSGSGQKAETSAFVLAPPAGVVHVDLRVRVLSVPPSQLVKAVASIQTVDGVELASETESTTVKP